MPGLQRAVLLRAAAAALAFGAALGAQAAVVPALAKRGVERAERDAYVCAEAVRMEAVARAGRSDPQGRPALLGDSRYEPGRYESGRYDIDRYELGWPPGCDPATR
ncbi:hypothetical protein ADK60_33020 [Streptomyces sp. XY431]|uniref:hypothetical protein n=1 Tax=Streptomyces sp. XY431 TaxID=1415562 RepID=UPI0006ADCBC0|nr:hypothetical protein [Streptomyces sp. XY431]KOV12171.1 hypothetical protein ADK60_33020 [Streptomyces sp. XY431]